MYSILCVAFDAGIVKAVERFFWIMFTKDMRRICGSIKIVYRMLTSDCNAVFLPPALKPPSAEHVENEVGKAMERYHVEHSCLLTLVLSFANG